MLNLIYGAKGTGKTKKIIDQANMTVSTGDTVFITDTDRYMFDIKRDIRVLNAVEYGIDQEKEFIGFVMGLVAGNSDIKHIFVDGAHRLVKKNIVDMEAFYVELGDIAEKYEVDITLTISLDKEELPKFLKKFL